MPASSSTLSSASAPRGKPRREWRVLARHQLGALAATGVDFAVMIACVRAGLAPAAGTAIGATCGAAMNFTLGRRWIFPAGTSRDSVRPPGAPLRRRVARQPRPGTRSVSSPPRARARAVRPGARARRRCRERRLELPAAARVGSPRRRRARRRAPRDLEPPRSAPSHRLGRLAHRLRRRSGAGSFSSSSSSPRRSRGRARARASSSGASSRSRSWPSSTTPCAS